MITTVPNPSLSQVRAAQKLASELSAGYAPRKTTISNMARQLGKRHILAVGERLTLYVDGKEVFFHPSMAVVRIKRLISGETDPLVENSGVRTGDVILDCTLGMGADAIVFAHAAGPPGKVIGIERHPVLAVLVREGLRTWPSDVPELTDAMRRVEVVAGDHLEYMRQMPDRSADVVYFDPMFRSTVREAVNFDPVRTLSVSDPLTPEAVTEAKRIARRSVILKERIGSGEFERLGFPPPRRRSSSFTYSVIRVQGEEGGT